MMITAAMVKELRDATHAGMLDCKKALEAYDGDMSKAIHYLHEKGLDRASQKAERETQTGLVVVKALGDTACAVEVNCETDFVAQTDPFKTFVHHIADQVLTAPNLTRVDSVLAAEFAHTPRKTNAEVIQELIGTLGENIVIGHVARYTLQGAGVVASYIHSGELSGFYAAAEGRIGVLVELGVDKPVVDQAALRSLAHDLTLHIASFGPRYLSRGDIPGEIIERNRADLWDQLAGEDKPDSVKTRIVEGRMNKFYQDACLLEQPYIKDDALTVENLLRQKSAEIGAVVTIRRFVRLDVGA